MALLGVPTLALSLAVTMVTTYLPVVARSFVGSNVVIGLIIGIEGLFALWLPLAVGAWSDRLQTRIGGRLPFLLAGSPVLIIGLVGMYPDAVSDKDAGRAQGIQALWRGAGTGLALLGGGLLLGVGQAAPFLVVAVAYAVAIGAFSVVLLRRGVPGESHAEGGARDAARAVWGLIRGSAVLASGKLADRFGATSVLRAALPVYGLGMLLPLLFTPKLLVALAIPFVAVGGGVIMALPYAVLIPLMPDDEHGALTGFYSLSRGIGTRLGPLLGGVAISLLGGYRAMWLVCGVAVLLSLWPLQRLRTEV